MTKTRKRERDGLVHFDGEKVARQRRRVGLTKSGLGEAAGVSRNTMLKAERGEGIFPSSAVLIAKALGLDDVEVLMPSQVENEPAGEVGEEPVGGEWRAVEYLGPWITASNGLQLRICRMEHRHVAGRRGRGKWYDLLHLATRTRLALRAHLLRHAAVCERIGTQPNLADNISASPGRNDNSWWVVDRWVEGRTLADHLREGPIQGSRLSRVMHEIALGLKALHKAKVVFRELAPSRVILAEEDGRAVLTDFELAKLLDSGPTVSDEWVDDPYRAPEVEDGLASEAADLYSWARILLHAATGDMPPPKGRDLEALTRVGIPKAVWRVAADCLAPGPSKRPRDIGQVLRVTGNWLSRSAGAGDG